MKFDPRQIFTLEAAGIGSIILSAAVMAQRLELAQTGPDQIFVFEPARY
jgi:hypothetical protein